ncbi:MAG TPA: RHS repeat-associated core domain-containing protein, partial [Nitrospira sp.]|nr:RHS repeat-associated core domain-containing protein [Nitrospira sp.]
MMSVQRIQRAYLAAILTSVSWLPFASAHADAVRPSEISSVDRNGIDLVNGTVAYSTRDISIGNGESGLARVGSNFSTPYGDNFYGVVQYNDDGDEFLVTFNGETEAFDSTTFASKSASGNTLYCVSGICTYTLKDGTVVLFKTGYGGAQGVVGVFAITSVTRPDGEIITFNYHRAQIANTMPKQYVSYLLSVSSSLGWMLKFHTLSDDPNVYPPSSVEAINTSVDYCDPAAMACSGETVSWSRMSLSNTGPINALGQKTVFNGGMSAPISIVSPTGVTKSITYYTSGTFSGMVHTVVVGSSTWTYAYSNSGIYPNYIQTTTVTNPDGGTHILTVNTGTSQILSDTDPLGRKITYTYYTTTGSGALNGALYQIISPDATYSGATVTGGYSQYTYDARGNILTETDVPKAGSGLSNLVTTYTYPSTCSNIKTCNKPTSVVDPNGVETDYTYDANSGNVATITTPSVNGVAAQERYTYTQVTPYIKNSSGGLVASTPVWRLSTVTSCMSGAASSCQGTSDEKKAVIGYGTNNALPVTVTTELGDNTRGATTTYTYDIYGDVTSVDGPFSGSDDTVYYFYDALQRRTGEIDEDPDGSGSLPRHASRTTFNTDGQVSKVETGYTSGTDATALASMSVLTTTTTDFDPSSGLPVKLSQFAGTGGTALSVSQTSYDSLYRVSCNAIRMNPSVYSSLPASACTLSTQGSDGADQITHYTYNSANTLLTTTTAYGTTAQTDAMTRTVNTSSGTTATLKDGVGNLTTYTYDGFNRLTKVCMPSASNGAVSSTSDCSQISYTNMRPTSLTLRDGQSESLGYDAAGRVNSRSGAGISESFTYNNFGQTKTHTNNGFTETLNYDGFGLLTSDAQPAGTVQYAYDAYGRRSQLTYPDGFYVTYNYYSDGRGWSIRDNSGNYILQDEPASSGVLNDEKLGNASPYAVLRTFNYDGLYRLSGISSNLSTTSSTTAYDNVTSQALTAPGQIKSRTLSNGAYEPPAPASGTTNYSLNGLNQVSAVSGAGFSYDSRGNLTSDGSASYGYNADNLLTSVVAGSSTTSLSYDAQSRLYRVVKTGSAATRFLYDGSDLIAEYDDSGNVLRRYVHGFGADQPVVAYYGSGTADSDRHYLVSDERGSIVAVTNNTGDIGAANTGVNTYNEYGLPGSSNIGRFQYTGQTWLPEVGLYYYKARMYSPSLGRFMQPDPIGYDDGLNIYAYVHGDPVNNTDPLGLETVVYVHGYAPVTDSAGDGGAGQDLQNERAAISAAVTERAKAAKIDDIPVIKVVGRRRIINIHNNNIVFISTGSDNCQTVYVQCRVNREYYWRRYGRPANQNNNYSPTNPSTCEGGKMMCDVITKERKGGTDRAGFG